MQFSNKPLSQINRFGFNRNREYVPASGAVVDPYIASHPIANLNGTVNLDTANIAYYGTTFTVTEAATMIGVQFSVSIQGVPDGEYACDIFSTTGSAGSETPNAWIGGMVAGDIISDITGTPTLKTFTYNAGGNALTPGVYFAYLSCAVCDASNYIKIGVDTGAGYTSGRAFKSTNGTVWTLDAANDLIFYALK